MRRKQHPGQIGDYWVSKRPNSPFWCRSWYDKTAKGRQTRRASLATEDREEAQRILEDWYARNVVLKQAPAAEAKLCDVIARYWDEHGSKVEIRSSIGTHKDIIAKTLEDDFTVAEFNIRAQERFVEALEAQGRSPGYVKRIFATVKAAILWAHRCEMITGHPPFLPKLPDGEDRDGISLSAIAALWDAAEQPYVQAFMMILLCTLCRPGAALDLTVFQCDLQRGLIDMNPPGRKRTPKRRPVIPMANTLRPWIVAAAGGHLVEYRGRPVRKINKTWRTLRELAGLGEDVVPYSIRHTMAIELRARGVPELELAGIMGHVMPNVRSTGRYAKYSPTYLGAAREAIDDVLNEIGRSANRPLIPINPDVRANCVLDAKSSSG